MPFARLRRLASGAGAALGRERLSILLFHRVSAAQDALFPAEAWAANFRAKMRLLRHFCHVLPLEEAALRLQAGTLPARAVCVTFDDGYADNHDVALPILREEGVHATFFIATAYLDGGRMWNDTVIETLRRYPGERLDLRALDLGEYDTAGAAPRRAAIDALLERIKYLPGEARQATVDAVARAAGVTPPDDLMMTRAKVRALHRAGMGIGAHTRRHPILARESADATRDEIAGGKAELEGIIDAPVNLFAYPNGKPAQDYRREHVEQVRDAGFHAAVSTAWGASRRGADAFQLARFTPWDIPPARFLARLLLSRRDDPAGLV